MQFFELHLQKRRTPCHGRKPQTYECIYHLRKLFDNQHSYFSSLHAKGYPVPTKQLMDKRVIITGASTGIGAAIACEYAYAGAHIWGAGGSDLEGLQNTINTCKEFGGYADGKCYDLSQARRASQLIRDGIDFLGGLDILVNCAGTRAFKPIVDITDDEVDLLFEVNAKSAYIASREAAKVMIPQKNGSILMVGSSAGHRGRADTSLYSVTKSVLHHLTKCLALELGPLGIRVNCLAPGLVGSPRVKARLDAKPEYLQSRLEGIPLHQLGTVENMAATALFLVSPRNEFMNGSIVLSDGGVTAG